MNIDNPTTQPKKSLNKEDYRKLLEFGIERLTEELSRVNHASDDDHIETIKRYILATLMDLDNATGRWTRIR